jgi:hypothetical protein
METEKELHLKIYLKTTPENLFQKLTTDDEREKFWAERSVETEGKISFTFPNGMIEHARIIRSIPDRIFEIEYFGSRVLFEIIPHHENECSLLLKNDRIPAGEFCEHYAGWVSVLMAFKAYVIFGADLRNHAPDLTWDQQYIDN